MKNIILKYGIISGSIIILSAIITIIIIGDSGDYSFAEWLGYLIMIVALSMIFIGIKDYKTKIGGAIDFKTAFKVGIGISLVASLLYIIGWEIYFSINGEQHIADYCKKTLDDISSTVSADDIEKAKKEFTESMELYRQLPYRLAITFVEIFPIALIITLISSLILKTKSKG